MGVKILTAIYVFIVEHFTWSSSVVVMRMPKEEEEVGVHILHANGLIICKAHTYLTDVTLKANDDDLDRVRDIMHEAIDMLGGD